MCEVFIPVRALVLYCNFSDESVDLEQAERDYNLSLDVNNHDILAVHGTNPPLIEKPAIAFPKITGKRFYFGVARMM